MTRYTLEPEIAAELDRMVVAERRSVANMVSVLITEAIVARLHPDDRYLDE